MSNGNKEKIVQMLHDYKTALEIAKSFARDNHTIKKGVTNLSAYSTQADWDKNFDIHSMNDSTIKN